MTIQVVGHRSFRAPFVIRMADMEFQQEQFDHLFDSARSLIQGLRNEGINPKADFGEDMLLLMIAEVCIRDFGSINYQLCHVAYRMADNEVENNSQFSEIEFVYD